MHVCMCLHVIVYVDFVLLCTWAVNNILFTERLQNTVSQGNSPLNTASGTECIAGAATTLQRYRRLLYWTQINAKS